MSTDLNYQFDPNQPPYQNNDAVIIHSIGDGKHYCGIIKGISVNHNYNVNVSPASIYIVELVDEIVPDCPFKFVTMPAACLVKA